MFKNNKIIAPVLDIAQLDEYIEVKEAQTVIFNDDIKEHLEMQTFRDYVASKKFLDQLMDFVAINYLKEYAGEDVKANIFTAIDYLRFNKRYESRTEKEALFSDINEIIITLNMSGKRNNYKFYLEQYAKRNGDKLSKLYGALYDKDFIDKVHESINYSIAYDYQVINDLMTVESEELFKTEITSDNLVSHYFLNTLEVLFVEMPSLYKDPRFLERVKYILENNKLLLKGKDCYYELDEDDVIDEFLLPRTKKLIKKSTLASR